VIHELLKETSHGFPKRVNKCFAFAQTFLRSGYVRHNAAPKKVLVDSMKGAMAGQAESERERRKKIIKAQGEFQVPQGSVCRSMISWSVFSHRLFMGLFEEAEKRAEPFDAINRLDVSGRRTNDFAKRFAIDRAAVDKVLASACR
jgi:hypothetical protein